MTEASLDLPWPNGLRITGSRATEGSDPSAARARVRCMRVLDDSATDLAPNVGPFYLRVSSS